LENIRVNIFPDRLEWRNSPKLWSANKAMAKNTLPRHMLKRQARLPSKNGRLFQQYIEGGHTKGGIEELES
jgi:hypothetical protein